MNACACNVICYGVKTNVRMYYVIRFDMKNVCLHVPYDMLWCAIYMFACAVQYALVCKMNVCMYHMICFCVQNECFHVANCVCCVVMNCWKPLSWYWNKVESPKSVIKNEL